MTTDQRAFKICGHSTEIIRQSKIKGPLGNILYKPARVVEKTSFDPSNLTQYGQQKSNEHQKDMENTITALE